MMGWAELWDGCSGAWSEDEEDGGEGEGEGESVCSSRCLPFLKLDGAWSCDSCSSSSWDEEDSCDIASKRSSWNGEDGDASSS